MVAYLTSYLVYGYLHKEETATYLMENRRIWIIPIINADAYKSVSDHFDQFRRVKIIQKNLRDDDEHFCGQ